MADGDGGGEVRFGLWLLLLSTSTLLSSALSFTAKLEMVFMHKPQALFNLQTWWLGYNVATQQSHEPQDPRTHR